MTDKPSFSIDLAGLKSRRKDSSPEAVERTDKVAERNGFVSREAPVKRGGRKPTPRTKQIHAWVEPEIATAIAEEADSKGVTQGELIADAWRLFKAR